MSADPATATAPTSRGWAVLDIDGVLADVRHRLRHVEGRPKDYGAFFRAAPQDPVLEVGLDTARRLAEVFDLVYLSGRPEWCRAETQAWFRRHGVPPGPLHLRAHGDHRPAWQIKVQALRGLQRQGSVAVVVDDDPVVLHEVRRAGFDVLPATWMGEAPALIEAQEQDGRA